jgi:hypothetical protein
MPHAPSVEQAQREIDIYLKTWQAMHPGSYARIVSEGRADMPPKRSGETKPRS